MISKKVCKESENTKEAVAKAIPKTLIKKRFFFIETLSINAPVIKLVKRGIATIPSIIPVNRVEPVIDKDIHGNKIVKKPDPRTSMKKVNPSYCDPSSV